MGTALTERHVATLRRYARRVVLALDPDAAGMAAAERAGDLFLSLASPEAMARSARTAERTFTAAQLDLRMASLPPGKDPDEIAAADPAQWQRLVDEAPPFAEFAIARILGDRRPDSQVERRQLMDRARPVIVAVTDPVERARYIQRVARFLDVDERSVQEQIGSRARGGPGRSREPRDDPPGREEMLLAVLFAHEPLRTRVRSLPLDLFNDSVNRELFQRWLHEEHADGPQVEEDEGDAVEARRRRVRAIRLPPLSEESARTAASRNVEAILRDRLIQRQAAVREEIADAERTLGHREVAQISHDAWMGGMPEDSVAAVAQAVIEELELGISIHRPKTADLV
jgi:DNA primase